MLRLLTTFSACRTRLKVPGCLLEKLGSRHSPFPLPSCLGRCYGTIPKPRGKVIEKLSLDELAELSTAHVGSLDLLSEIEIEKSSKRVRKSKKLGSSIPHTLIQGLISSDDTNDEGTTMEPPAGPYPTVVQQAKNNMLKFRDCVVLTRVGSFYELYFEQAEIYAPQLNIKLSAKRTNAGMVSMAGFPFFQLDRYLKILVQDLGKHVAISEEIPNEPAQKVKTGGLLFDRQVQRIITPGTLIDENFLHPNESNYLLAIHIDLPSDPSWGSDGQDSLPRSNRAGLSWLDLSSGDFFTQTTDIESLPSAIARIDPREIIFNQVFEQSHDARLHGVLAQQQYTISYHDTTHGSGTIGESSCGFNEGILNSTPEVFTPEETTAANLLLQYVKTQLPGFNMRLQTPVRRETGDYMTIDKNSLRSLELTETLRDGLFKGSLLQAVRRTSTASGARLLTQRLTFPSMSLDTINERLDLVEELMKDEALLEDTTTLLRRTADTLRLLQKFSFGRGDADDLHQLSQTIELTENIVNLPEHSSHDSSPYLTQLLDKLNLAPPRAVAERITLAIDEEGLILRQRSEDASTAEAVSQAREVIEAEDDMIAPELGDLRKTLATKRVKRAIDKDDDKIPPDEIWVMRRNATPTLERLHDKLAQLTEEKNQLAKTLREQLNADTLALKFTPGLGHICHVRGKDSRLNFSTLPDVRTVGSTKSTRSFYLPEWTKLGNSIEDAKLRIRKEEQLIFQTLRDLVIQNLVVLRKNAAVLDELDVACSSATLGLEHNLKRPKLNGSCNHTIYGGRHMMVEMGLAESGRQFIPNDCVLNDKERIWLITGPNMAGKSTFLRQTALTSILAQTGSFVPAEYVEIGLVDQIFSRVGSADNLSQDQSTFMVEMLETAHIMRNATPRSFVIMDEVGRGTTPEDGTAVAFAVLHQLQNVNRCRTLFATHFHALADMTEDFQSLACYCTDVVDEPGGSFRYDHRLKKGINRQSHALKVALLAGMPAEVIAKAKAVLEERFNKNSPCS